ncbi:MAG: CPBP family intramembrane metalloprotease [Pseudobutyrivibrio sp.]|nr:CPBP family intramembrane metalloprotease [Pseudobutyrivibrio sp.]
MERKEIEIRLDAKTIFRMLLPVMSIYLIQYFCSTVVTEILMVYDLRHYSSGSFYNFLEDFMKRSTSVEVTTIINIAYSIVASLIFAWWYITKETEPGKVKHPFKGLTSNFPLMITGLILVVLGLHYVAFYLMNAMAVMFPEMAAEYNQMLDGAGIKAEDISPAVAAYAVILGPVCEELAFRGLTYKATLKAMPFVWANLVQALLFAAIHGSLIQSSYAFVMAMVLGYIMYKYDNIILCIVVHMLFNLLGSVLSTFFMAGMGSPMVFFIWFLGSMVVTYVGITMLYKAAPVKEAKTPEE